MNAQFNYDAHKPTDQKFPVRLLLDNLGSPENLGMLFRIADTMGVSEIWLCGEKRTSHLKKLSRTARGAERHVPFSYFETLEQAFKIIDEKALTLVALEISAKSIDLKKADFKTLNAAKNGLVLAVGAENLGLNAEILKRAALTVHIPTHGFCLSMNVATATAVAVYEITRQLQEA
jgi:tRNA G18 (ribose-2'-O)-methylase SpoU